jgi:hypothetical protein
VYVGNDSKMNTFNYTEMTKLLREGVPLLKQFLHDNEVHLHEKTPQGWNKNMNRVIDATAAYVAVRNLAALKTAFTFLETAIDSDASGKKMIDWRAMSRSDPGTRSVLYDFMARSQDVCGCSSTDEFKYAELMSLISVRKGDLNGVVDALKSFNIKTEVIAALQNALEAYLVAARAFLKFSTLTPKKAWSRVTALDKPSVLGKGTLANLSVLQDMRRLLER